MLLIRLQQMSSDSWASCASVIYEDNTQCDFVSLRFVTLALWFKWLFKSLFAYVQPILEILDF